MPAPQLIRTARCRPINVRIAHPPSEEIMKIKTNVRAGAGGASGAGHNTPGDNSPITPPVVYYPPVGRCVGI